MPSPHTAAASQTATGRGTHVSHTARHRRMCAPRAGRVYGWASVVLAAAHDAEGGWLGSSKIVWRSSIDGAIATGAYAVVTTEDLTAGTHTITATATDSDNTAGSASVTVIVRATNDAPAAADDVLRAVLGRGVDLAVLANDADTEGDIFTHTLAVRVPAALGEAGRGSRSGTVGYGETYTDKRAPVSSVRAVGPDRVVVTVQRTAIARPGDYRGTLTIDLAPWARFLVVYTDGGRWAAAQSPTASLGWSQKPPGLRPLVTDDPVVTSVSSSKYPRRFAAGDTIVLAALTNPGAVHHAVNCNHDGAVVSWSSDIDGSLDSLIDAPDGPCAPYLLDASELTAAEHQFTASVTDHRGLTATVPAKWVFTIAGDPAAVAERIPIIARDDYVYEAQVPRDIDHGVRLPRRYW